MSQKTFGVTHNISNHKCKLADGTILNFDVSNSKQNVNPNVNVYDELGFGEYYSVDVDGISRPLTGTGYFFKRKINSNYQV